MTLCNCSAGGYRGTCNRQECDTSCRCYDREDRALVEELRRVFDDHGLAHVQATYRTAPDAWRTIKVREVSVIEDAAGHDGLVVEVEDNGL